MSAGWEEWIARADARVYRVFGSPATLSPPVGTPYQVRAVRVYDAPTSTRSVGDGEAPHTGPAAHLLRSDHPARPAQGGRLTIGGWVYEVVEVREGDGEWILWLAEVPE